jgi:hypothetical protein
VYSCSCGCNVKIYSRRKVSAWLSLAECCAFTVCSSCLDDVGRYRQAGPCRGAGASCYLITYAPHTADDFHIGGRHCFLETESDMESIPSLHLSPASSV